MRRSYQFHKAHTVKRCGLFSFATTREDEVHAIVHISKSRCKSYSCPRCRPLRLRQMRARFIKGTTQGTWRFITLTIPVGEIPRAERYAYLKMCWQKMALKLRKEYPGLKYIRVLDTGVGGNCHYHILWNKFIEIKEIRKLWIASGGGFIVNSKLIPAGAAAHYMSKYVTSCKALRSDVEKIIYETSSRRFTATNDTLPKMSRKAVNLVLRSLSYDAIWDFIGTWMAGLGDTHNLSICSDISSARPHPSLPHDQLVPNLLIEFQPSATFS